MAGTLSDLVGPNQLHEQPLLLRGRVAQAPVDSDSGMMVTLEGLGADHGYDIPPGQWIPRGSEPAAGDLCLVGFDEHGDAWALLAAPVSGLPDDPAILLGGNGYSLRINGPDSDPFWAPFDSSVRGDISASYPIAFSGGGVISLTTGPRGAIITYQSGLAVPALLSIGALGDVLTSDGNEPAWLPPMKKRNPQAGNYTALATDHLIAVTSTAAARTITLPAVASVPVGKTYIVKDESGGAGTNNITIDANGTETIDGALTTAIVGNYGSIEVYNSGTQWHKL